MLSLLRSMLDSIYHRILKLLKIIFWASFTLNYTRGIWKVLSMGLYLSNQFTNPIMFGINLKSYLSSMLWHKFHEAI